MHLVYISFSCTYTEQNTPYCVLCNYTTPLLCLKLCLPQDHLQGSPPFVPTCLHMCSHAELSAFALNFTLSLLAALGHPWSLWDSFLTFCLPIHPFWVAPGLLSRYRPRAKLCTATQTHCTHISNNYMMSSMKLSYENTTEIMMSYFQTMRQCLTTT